MREKSTFFVLRILLATLIIADFFVWGFPALLGNSELADFIGIDFPRNTYYLRLVGVLTLCFGFVYIPVFLRPERYSFLVTIGIIDTGMTAFVTFFWLFQNMSKSNAFLWFTAIICLSLAIGFSFFHPNRKKLFNT